LRPLSKSQFYGIKSSNLFAQNTSHFNAASGSKAVDEQGQQGSKEHLE